MTPEDTAYCMNCGSEISGDTNFCPECGSSQEPEKIEAQESKVDGQDVEKVKDDGFTSWAIGFQPGKTGRNILVGLAYFLFYFVGIPLLMYAYLRENPDKAKYFAWVGGVLIILMAIPAISQGTVWGFIAGGIILLLGLFFLPIIRKKLGLGSVPGIDVEDSARRSVIVGTGYAIGSMALVGSALPETETAPSDADGKDANGNSNGGVEFAVRVLYDGSWQGAISVTEGGSSQTESISGSGSETIDITGNVDIISANAQKEDDSSAELVIQILQNGDVVSEASTTAEYGVAQTSESF